MELSSVPITPHYVVGEVASLATIAAAGLIPCLALPEPTRTRILTARIISMIRSIARLPDSIS